MRAAPGQESAAIGRQIGAWTRPKRRKSFKIADYAFFSEFTELLMSISSTQEIIAELRAGRMVVLVDDEDRENEGDLMLASDFVTPEAINFMARYARGLVCLTLTAERCEQLELTMMTAKNGTSFGTNFTVSIEAAEGVTTGISAADRARTIQVAVDKNSKPFDIVQPGHIFPVRA